MKVLIVEDSADRQNVLKNLYKFHQIEIAETSNDALCMLKMNSFDILHLDYDLDCESTSEIVAHELKKRSLNCIIIIHSENPDGVTKLQELLPKSFTIPISHFAGKNPFSSKLKSILASQEKESFSRVKKTLEENSNSKAV